MRKAFCRIGRSLLDAGSLSSRWRKETSVPRRVEPLPEATLLPSAGSAQVTANSKRMNSRWGTRGKERGCGGSEGIVQEAFEANARP